VEVADVMAGDYGKRACYQKVMTTLSLSLSLSRFLISVSFSYKSASELSWSNKKHSAKKKKLCPKRELNFCY
jgi:hypothetical protein